MSREAQHYVDIAKMARELQAAFDAEEDRELLLWAHGFLVGLADRVAGRVFDPNEQPMRDKDEVQKAHDQLRAVLLEEVLVPNPYIARRTKAGVTAALDALCWVLRHDHNQTFAENLHQLDKYLVAHGFELRRVP